MNIALYYFGASGGFYALWHILIGTEYRCKFSIDIEEITDIYKHHWDITEKPKWKATEIHPNNNLTKQKRLKWDSLATPVAKLVNLEILKSKKQLCCRFRWIWGAWAFQSEPLEFLGVKVDSVDV